MKKVFLIAAAVLLVSFSQAQQFGVKAGLTMPKVSFEENDDVKMAMGFQVGGVATLPLGPLELEANVLLSQKGFKLKKTVSEFGAEVTTTYKFKPLYLDIPVKLNYHIDLAGIGLFFGAGPTLGFGIAGKEKTSFEVSGVKFPGMDEELDKDKSEKIEWGGDNGPKRLDFGLGLQAGVKIIDKIRVGLSYDLGLTDLDKDVKSKNRVFAIYGAFMF